MELLQQTGRGKVKETICPIPIYNTEDDGRDCAQLDLSCADEDGEGAKGLFKQVASKWI